MNAETQRTQRNKRKKEEQLSVSAVFPLRPLRLCVHFSFLALTIGCTAATRPAAAKTSHHTDQLSAILNSQHTQVIYGCRIIDLTTGRDIYDHNIDLPLMPASNLKLFTAATALDRFGPDAPLKTLLAYDGKNLWILGGGDPACGDPDMAKANHQSITAMFDQWAAVLKKDNLSHINGNIYYDARIFDHQLTNPTWSPSYLGDWYAAPVAGLNFNDNCIDVTVKPTHPGKPMRISIAPPVGDVNIINHTRTQKKDDAYIQRHGQSNDYLITGGGDRTLTLDSKPVTNPAAFFADAMRTNFESHGIHIAGKNLPPPAHPSHKLQILATHITRLSDAVHRMDKDSQNLFAEALCKLLGRSYATHNLHENLAGSWQLGFDAIRAFLSHHHIDPTNLNMVDGSGLSRQDHVTVHQVTDLLSLMWRRPARQAFFDSLPTAGVDGTLRHRMRSVAGKVHAKTGYIHGVRSLSGYISTKSGHTLAFSIIFNKIPGTVRPYEAIQDRICETLVREY